MPEPINGAFDFEWTDRRVVGLVLYCLFDLGGDAGFEGKHCVEDLLTLCNGRVEDVVDRRLVVE